MCPDLVDVSNGIMCTYSNGMMCTYSNGMMCTYSNGMKCTYSNGIMCTMRTTKLHAILMKSAFLCKFMSLFLSACIHLMFLKVCYKSVL